MKKVTAKTVRYYAKRNEIIFFNAQNIPVGGAKGRTAENICTRLLERGINVELINE